MKRVSIIVLALVACLAVGSIGVATASSGKTKVSLSYSVGTTPPYGQASFNGKVRASRSCKKSRKVTVIRVGKPTIRVGKAKTGKQGKFTISAGSGAAKGTYRAKVKRKGKCKQAKSKKVTVS